MTAKSQQPLRILMLHGYTQSGPLFRAKTRALEKNLQKAFPQPVQLIYPTAPIRLNPAELPSWDSNGNVVPPRTANSASSSAGDLRTGQEGGNVAQEEEPDAWTWWKVADRSVVPYSYDALEVGLGRIAQVLADMGPFDGVIGFSQGGAFAAMVASLLEEGRVDAFERYAQQVRNGTWTDGALSGTEFAGFDFVPESYPTSFLTEDGRPIHPPLKFAVSYSGFASNHPKYGAYYSPKISTPLLSFIGSLDTVVREDRTLLLVAGSKNHRVVYHPGGHFVPSSAKEFVGHLIGFIREELVSKTEVAMKEESVEDMQLPF
jgi:hypothetical protein